MQIDDRKFFSPHFELNIYTKMHGIFILAIFGSIYNLTTVFQGFPKVKISYGVSFLTISHEPITTVSPIFIPGLSITFFVKKLDLQTAAESPGRIVRFSSVVI